MKQLTKKKTSKKPLVQFYAMFTAVLLDLETWSSYTAIDLYPKLQFKTGRDKNLELLLSNTETDVTDYREDDEHSIIFYHRNVPGISFDMSTHRRYGFEVSWGATKRGNDCVILIKIYNEFHVLVFKDKARRRSQMVKDLLSGKLNERLPGRTEPTKALFKQIFKDSTLFVQDTLLQFQAESINVLPKKEVPARSRVYAPSLSTLI